MDTPLRKMPEVETVDEEDEDLADHIKQRRPGEDNPNQEALKFDVDVLETPNPTVSNLTPEEMIGRTFLMPPEEDGTRHRAKIIKRIDNMQKDIDNDPLMIKFKCKVNKKYNEIVAYNDIVDYIEEDRSTEGVWKFEEILNHKKVKPNDPMYMGSSYYVLL